MGDAEVQQGHAGGSEQQVSEKLARRTAVGFLVTNAHHTCGTFEEADTACLQGLVQLPHKPELNPIRSIWEGGKLLACTSVLDVISWTAGAQASIEESKRGSQAFKRARPRTIIESCIPSSTEAATVWVISRSRANSIFRDGANSSPTPRVEQTPRTTTRLFLSSSA